MEAINAALEDTPAAAAGGEEDQGIIDLAKRCLKDARDVKEEWLRECEESDRFYHGHHWRSDLVAEQEKVGKPALTFNYCRSYVDAVVGLEIQNRERSIFVPRYPTNDNGSSEYAELATDANEWALASCRGHYERDRAFSDMVRRGMGWMERRIDDEEDDESKLLWERVDGKEMWWDHASRKQNLEDAEWICRRRWMRRTTVKDLWPEMFPYIGASDQWEGDELDHPTRIERRSSQQIGVSDGNGSITTVSMDTNPSPADDTFMLVTDFQWKSREPIYEVENPLQPGTTSLLTEGELEDLKEAVGDKLVSKRTRSKRVVYRRAFIAGDVVLQKEVLKVQGGFTFQAMTWLWDDELKIWYGLIRCLRDPQKAANKWYSQMTHIFSVSPKGSVFVEKTAVTDPERFRREYASPGGVHVVEDGAMAAGRIHWEQPAPLPTALPEFLKHAIGAFKDVSGINIELLGASEGNMPGVTMRQRQAQGMAILAMAFMALRRFREVEAKQNLKWLAHYIADDRWVRIGGPYEGRALQLKKDPLLLKYDVLVDESPHNPNTKMEFWELMQPIIPVLIRNGVFVPEMLDFAPLPAVVVAKIKQRMEMIAEAQKNAPPEKAGKDPRQIEAEVERTKAQTQLTLVRAQAIQKDQVLDEIATMMELKGQKDERGMRIAKGISDILIGFREQKASEAERYQKRLDDKSAD